MVNKYRFTRKNPKTKKIENTGYMEIRNAAAGAELYIYGDIVSSSWDVWSADDTCPQDIADFMNQIESYMISSQYAGLMNRARKSGRLTR